MLRRASKKSMVTLKYDFSYMKEKLLIDSKNSFILQTQNNVSRTLF